MKYKKYYTQAIYNYLKGKNKIKRDIHVQRIYNNFGFGYNRSNDYNLLEALEQYNLELSVPFLATGQNGYFNEQIEANGLSNLKLADQDIEDANFIANCFGKKLHYSDNNIPIVYTALLGTVEFNYASQSFPAGIFEDVFQCDSNHKLPIEPIVGEREQDYYLRLLALEIKKEKQVDYNKINEVMLRAKRLIERFCKNKNRIYLINLDDVLKLKASFGDIKGLRDGTLSKEESLKKIESLQSLEEMLPKFNIYGDSNFTTEYGVALYGNIPLNKLYYIDVERIYNLMQKRAIDLGYQVGDSIPLYINQLDEKGSVQKGTTY